MLSEGVQEAEDFILTNAKVLVRSWVPSVRLPDDEDIQILRETGPRGRRGPGECRAQIGNVLRERDDDLSCLVLAALADPHEEARRGCTVFPPFV